MSHCAFGRMTRTGCQKHTTPPHNRCSHKLPEQLLRSGTIPGSAGTSFLPVPSPPTHCMQRCEHGWETDSDPDFPPLLNRGMQTWLVRGGTSGFSPSGSVQRGREKYISYVDIPPLKHARRHPKEYHLLSLFIRCGLNTNQVKQS